MKKNLFRFFVCCGILAAAVSCVNEKLLDTNETELVYMTFDAGTTGVKSTFTSDYKEIHWTVSDAISVFYPMEDQTYANAKFTDEELTSQSPTAHFSGEATVAEKYYAVYPYDANAKCSTDGVITTMLPTVQVATAGTFDPSASLAVATSGSAKSFSFASVCGWVGFEIPEGVTDIAQVTLAGLNHLNPIAGEVNISEDLTVITTENNDANNVVLVPAEGQDYIPAGKYYMSVIAGQKEGITVRVVTTDGKYGHKTLENATLTVTANKRIALPVYNAEDYEWEADSDVLKLEFSTASGGENQPLDVDVPGNSGVDEVTVTTGNLKGTQHSFTFATTRQTISGGSLRMAKRLDYILFPAIENKRLVEVKLVTEHSSGDYRAAICLPSENNSGEYVEVAGGEGRYTPNAVGGLTVWTLTGTEAGEAYRLVRTSHKDFSGSYATNMRVTSVELTYVGASQPDVVIDMLKPECMTYLGTGSYGSNAELSKLTFDFPQTSATDVNGIAEAKAMDCYSYTVNGNVYSVIGFTTYMQGSDQPTSSYYYWSEGKFCLFGKQTMKLPAIAGYRLATVTATTSAKAKLIVSKDHLTSSGHKLLDGGSTKDHSIDVLSLTSANTPYYIVTAGADIEFSEFKLIYTPAN